ncbi:MAG TPA: hypothetical protein ENK18_05900 [Deltaproteobacteria bacterium]|nr:hypothetical protein [Deltaproteobacteria bacterium]
MHTHTALSALLVVTLLTPGCGASRKVDKASKALARFEAGDRRSIAKAHSKSEAAVETRRGNEDPWAWAIRGRVALGYLTHSDLAPPEDLEDPAIVAIEAFEHALELGASGGVHAGLSRDVPILESALIARLRNAVEGRSWELAEEELALALRARELSERLGRRDRDREIALQTLAVQVTTEARQLDDAMAHYDAFLHASETHETGLVSLVARALAAQGRVEDALTFLEPASLELPDDERLLRAEVDVLQQAGRLDEAAGRVERRAARLSSSTSGCFLLASMYVQIGATERARDMWAKTLELDPRHFDAHLELGRSLASLASEVRARVEASEDLETPLASEEIRMLAEELDALWRDAAQHLEIAHELDSQRREPLQELVALYERKLEGVEISQLQGARLLAYEEDLVRQAAAVEALAELEG